MRRQGAYIVDRRLKFKKGLQRRFLEEIKNKSGLTWKDLANKINLSEHTLKVDWLKERTTIPNRIAELLIKDYLSSKKEQIFSNWIEKILPERWGQILSGDINKKKIKNPKKSEELSELFGVILGDGHLERKTLTITGNIYEKSHHNYIKENIRTLFGINSVTLYNKRSHVCILKVHSTELIKYLIQDGLVLGNKIKNKAELPSWIFEQNGFIAGALRGLFDTDGGIYSKQKNYKRAIIKFQTHSPNIRKNIFEMLKKIGLTASKSSVNVRIQNQNEINRFFKLVGSSNPKNIIRYKHFIKSGEIPLKEKLIKEVTNLKIEKPFKAALV